MNMQEYQRVKDFTYLQYCDYLQSKYGIGKTDYMTKSYYRKNECSRTSEGLITHHKMEDRMIMLSNRSFAISCPFEWQKKENLIYCDYLEHLLLHVLICKYPSPEKEPLAAVGIGGVINFIVPELNDFYSGWISKESWRQNCHNLVKNDKEVYLAILKQFIDFKKTDKRFDLSILLSSYNEKYNLWNHEYNQAIFREIERLF